MFGQVSSRAESQKRHCKYPDERKAQIENTQEAFMFKRPIKNELTSRLRQKATVNVSLFIRPLRYTDRYYGITDGIRLVSTCLCLCFKRVFVSVNLLIKQRSF